MSLLEKLKIAINNNKILVSEYISEDVINHKQYLEDNKIDSKIIFTHRGVKGNHIYLNISLIENPELKFLYVRSEEHDEEYIYFCDSKVKTELITSLGIGEDKNNNQEYYYGIDVSDKLYCIELKYNMDQEFYINYITTLPKGCSDKFCGKLNGLFYVLFEFFKAINFTSRIALKDDVYINNVPVTYLRILEGKGSIYEKYGFKIFPEISEKILKAKEENNKELLMKLCRNIPMIAENCSKFKNC